jgi:hypothetical protein
MHGQANALNWPAVQLRAGRLRLSENRVGGQLWRGDEWAEPRQEREDCMTIPPNERNFRDTRPRRTSTH